MFSRNPFTGVRYFRGPKTDLEFRITTRLTIFSQYEHLRTLLLESLTSTNNDTVQSRELVLRVMASELAPVFVKVITVDLSTDILEKIKVTEIEAKIKDQYIYFETILTDLITHGVPKAQTELIKNALQSETPKLRVAACCAIILLLILVERRISFTQGDEDERYGYGYFPYGLSAFGL
jgi:hypothetical protein